jgi:3-oxoacyl-[acyl-carrier protein] reductase
MEQDLSRRVALVTGASRGLGRAIAIRLAEDGCDVAITYEVSDELALATAAEIEAKGAKARIYQLDVAEPTAVRRVVDDLVANWLRIDVLVCNAGIFSRSLIHETSDEEFARTFAVNVGGVFYMMRTVLPIMMGQRSGRVINISSHNAKRGTGASSKATYAATKNAVESYTKGAAIEMAPYNVTVNAVSPGWIEKEPHHGERTELHKQLLAAIPLHRPGTPDEIAAAVSYLASDLAGYVTGEILDVNGGTWMD